MLSTRNDRVLKAEAAPGDVLALTITTGGGSIDIDWGDGTPVDTVASGVRQEHQYSSGYTGDVVVSANDSTDMLQTYTDWVIEGNFVGDASQLPTETSSAIIRNGNKIEQKAEWVPPTLSTLTATNNSGLTAEESDKIIRAIEAGTQNNGILKLNGQVGLATAELDTLTDAGGRNWGVEQRPDVVFESEPAEYPYSRKLSDNRWRLAQTNAPGTPRPEQRTRPMVFNGTSDRVEGPAIAELPTDQITYCAWFRVTSTTPAQVIMSTRTQSNQGVTLRVDNGGLRAYLGNGSAEVNIFAGGVVTAGKWHHAAVTFDSYAVRLYLDGEEVGTDVLEGFLPIVHSGTALGVGSRSTGFNYFGGGIMDVRVYDRNLQPDELVRIAAMSEGSDDVGPLDPVIWYLGGGHGYQSRIVNVARNGVDNYDATVISSAMLTFNGYYADDFFSWQNQFGYNTGPALDTTGLATWTSALGGKTALTGEFEIRYRALLHNAYESFIGVTNATGLARTDTTYAAIATNGYGGHTLGNVVRARWKVSQTSVNSPLANDLNPEVIVRRDSDDLVTITIDGVEYLSTTDADTLYFYSTITFAASHMSCPVITHMSIDGVAVDPYEEFEPTNGGKIIDAGFIPVKPGETTDIYGNTPRYLGEIPREPRVYTKVARFENNNLDKVFAPNPLDRHVGSFTYEARFTTPGATRVYPMIFTGQVAAIEMRLKDGNVVEFIVHSGLDWTQSFGGTTGVFSEVLPYDTWVHAVGVYDAGAAKVRLYIDGRLVDEQDVTGAEDANTHDPVLYAGARLNSYYHDGFLQDQRVYTRALTEAEVKSNYAGNAPVTGGLVMDWAYNDGAGDRIHNVAPQEGWVSSGTGTTEGTSYIDTGVTLDGATEFTVFRRMRYLSKSSYDLDGFFGTTHAGRVRIGRNNSNNNFWLDGAASSETIASVDLDDGIIQSTAITCKVGELARTYVDGDFKASSVGSMGAAIANNSPARNYYIGAANESGGILNHSNAEYYEYWIYSRKLTDDEILYLHTQGASGTDPGDTNLEYRQLWHGWPGKLSSTNETDFWAGSQDVNERQLRVGHHAATKYSGVGQHFESESDTTVGDGLGLAYTFTTSFWLKSIGDNDGMLTFDSNWPTPSASALSVSIHSSVDVISVRMNDQVFYEDQPYPWDNEWHHIAIVYDSLDVIIYIDGAEANRWPFFDTVDFRGCEMILGAYYTASYPLAGHLSDVVLQLHPATPAEVLDLMAGKNIRSDAFRFPFGNGIETNRGAPPMTKIGAPETYGVQARQFPFTPHDYDHAATLYDGINDSYSGWFHNFSNVSVAFWMRSPAPGANAGVIGKWDTPGKRSWMVYLNSNGHITAFQSADGENSAWRSYETNVADGVLRHFACILDATTGVPVIYVDGELVPVAGSGTQVGSPLASDNTIEIGRYDSNDTYCVEATLSRIIVEDAIWTPEQVADIRSGELVRPNAFYFPRGDGREVQRGLNDLTANGDPAPVSAKTLPLPVRGPGVLSPSHQLVLPGDPNSVVGRKLAGRTFKAGDYTGNVGDNRQFGNPDDTVTVYETAMSAALANEVSTSHIKGNL